jgi:hypothetical protein
MMDWKSQKGGLMAVFCTNLVPGLKAEIVLFQENRDESNEKWYVGLNCCVLIRIIHHTNNQVCVMLSTGVVQKKS